jgi:hypothetical protein
MRTMRKPRLPSNKAWTGEPEIVLAEVETIRRLDGSRARETSPFPFHSVSSRCGPTQAGGEQPMEIAFQPP